MATGTPKASDARSPLRAGCPGGGPATLPARGRSRGGATCPDGCAPGARPAAPYAAFGAARTSTGDEQSAKARAEAAGHRQALTERLTGAVKLVATQHLRDAPRAAAYFRLELLQAPAAAPAAAAAA